MGWLTMLQHRRCAEFYFCAGSIHDWGSQGKQIGRALLKGVLSQGLTATYTVERFGSLLVTIHENNHYSSCLTALSYARYLYNLKYRMRPLSISFLSVIVSPKNPQTQHQSIQYPQVFCINLRNRLYSDRSSNSCTRIGQVIGDLRTPIPMELSYCRA